MAQVIFIISLYYVLSINIGNGGDYARKLDRTF